MSDRRDTLVLGIQLEPVPGNGAWRRADSGAEAAFTLDGYRRIAARAEAASLHYLFVADGPTHDAERFPTNPFRVLEALTVVAALAGVTRRIGLIASLSTTFFAPYNLARQLASLDHLSGGRAGWNVVTSFGGAEHYGDDELLEHDLRYERAAEVLRAADLLWDGWGPDAVRIDRATGTWGDPDQVRAERFAGRHVRLTGPLNLPRSPQQRPVISQAGGSEAGRELGARFADLIYTNATSLDGARRFYADLKQRAARIGRDPDTLKIVPGIAPIVAATETEARALDRDLAELIDLPSARAALSSALGGIDLSDLGDDDPVPVTRLLPGPAGNGVRSHLESYRELVARGLSVRELAVRTARGTGRWAPVGSVEQVADAIEHAFRTRAADGLTFSAPYLPGGLEAITDLLVPELRRRGLFPDGYAHPTLRENLGVAPGDVALRHFVPADPAVT